jgi:hypothetical protein
MHPVTQATPLCIFNNNSKFSGLSSRIRIRNLKLPLPAFFRPKMLFSIEFQQKNRSPELPGQLVDTSITAAYPSN